MTVIELVGFLLGILIGTILLTLLQLAAEKYTSKPQLVQVCILVPTLIGLLIYLFK